MPQTPTTVNVSPTDPTILVGNSMTPTVQVLNQFGTPYTGPLPVLYSSDDPSIASVNSSGLVTGVSVGDTKINVTCGAAGGGLFPKIRV